MPSVVWFWHQRAADEEEEEEDGRGRHTHGPGFICCPFLSAPAPGTVSAAACIWPPTSDCLTEPTEKSHLLSLTDLYGSTHTGARCQPCYYIPFGGAGVNFQLPRWPPKIIICRQSPNVFQSMHLQLPVDNRNLRFYTLLFTHSANWQKLPCRRGKALAVFCQTPKIFKLSLPPSVLYGLVVVRSTL